MTLDAYLGKMFLTPTKSGVHDFDVLIFYDRANGIRFPIKEMREIFMREVGLTSKPTKTAGIFQQSGDVGQLPRDPVATFDLIAKMLQADRRDSDGKQKHTVLVIDYAETIFPSGTLGTMSGEDRHCLVKILNWARDSKINENANPIIMIADSGSQLNEAITASASRIEMLEVMLPSPEDRLSFIEYMEACEKQKQRDAKQEPIGLSYEKGFNAKRFAHLTAGLKKLNIEDIKLTATKSNLPIGPDIVNHRKSEIYRQEYQSQLEIIDPQQGFEVVGGMKWLKDYLREEVVEPMIEGDITRCPMGILFTGPPGTGKTALAMALAYEAHMNPAVGKLLCGHSLPVWK